MREVTSGGIARCYGRATGQCRSAGGELTCPMGCADDSLNEIPLASMDCAFRRKDDLRSRRHWHGVVCRGGDYAGVLGQLRLY